MRKKVEENPAKDLLKLVAKKAKSMKKTSENLESKGDMLLVPVLVLPCSVKAFRFLVFLFGFSKVRRLREA